MSNLLRQIFNWAEVWALLIPFPFIFPLKKTKTLRPVTYYVFVSLIIYLIINIISNQKSFNIDLHLHSNVLIYNINSIIRLFLLSWYFISLRQPFFVNTKKVLPWIFASFVFVFFLFEPINGKYLNSTLHIVETGLLLLYCIQYYFFLLKEEQPSFARLPSFWVVTGLSIFVVVNFPIYLFYDTVIKLDTPTARLLWDIHKPAFIIFCICLAKAFYESKR